MTNKTKKRCSNPYCDYEAEYFWKDEWYCFTHFMLLNLEEKKDGN